MRLSSEIANLTSELRQRYARILAAGDPAAVRRANATIAALYALSCGSLVVALNALGGRPWRRVLIERRGVSALAVAVSGAGMLERTIGNAEQFDAITGAISDARTRARMNRYLAEWREAIDQANVRLHALGRHGG